nr:hypothetical protein BaRGS_025741 [Batillaria attramentaria]
MKPVVPQKRRSGFSIESIIGSTTTTTTTTSNNSNDNRDDDGADSDHIHSSKNIDRHVVSDRTEYPHLTCLYPHTSSTRSGHCLRGGEVEVLVD